LQNPGRNPLIGAGSWRNGVADLLVRVSLIAIFSGKVFWLQFFS
jgi:hypothetical protein